MSQSISPKLYDQIKSIYTQKNSLLRFRVLRLQRELREAKETLSALACAHSDSQQTLLMLKYEQSNGVAMSTQDIVKHNAKISGARSRIIELSAMGKEIERNISELEEAIPLCTKMEAKNNIRCDYLQEQVREPEESEA